jgi:3-hydroxy-3-methylglutaryl CoA synthase
MGLNRLIRIPAATLTQGKACGAKQVENRGGKMAGITSIGAYIPKYRLNLAEVAGFWRIRGSGGEKAVAGYDEDSITMAVAATLECLGMDGRDVNGLYFATTTNPYKEKQGAAIIGSAADLSKDNRTADFADSLRSGTIAMRAAADAVNCGSAKKILVTVSDSRLGAPQGRHEQLLGDGAAAIAIGGDQPIAEIEDGYSVFNDFTDAWKTAKDDFVQSAEGRFVDVAGFTPTMQDGISGLLKKCGAAPKDFSKVVFPAPGPREHADLAKRLGFEKSQVQDPLFAAIGHTGVAASFLMLIAVLQESEPGDRILFANYGDGCDAFALRATDSVSRARRGRSVKDALAKKEVIDYGKYLNWRNLIPLEASSLPARAEPSLITRWRDRRSISALFGVRCKSCGTPQIHPIGQTIRVCAVCQSKDNFEDYRFSDKKGRLFSYAIDQLQPTKNPPGLNGVVDFDGGGRLICELTDYDLDQVRIGMPVEMTFRKMSQGQGIINYFWKAKPVAE